MSAIKICFPQDEESQKVIKESLCKLADHLTFCEVFIAECEVLNFGKKETYSLISRTMGCFICTCPIPNSIYCSHRFTSHSYKAAISRMKKEFGAKRVKILVDSEDKLFELKEEKNRIWKLQEVVK